MNPAADTFANLPRMRAPRGRFGMPRDVWWGCTTSLVVFVLAPFAVTFLTWLSVWIFFPIGAFMGYVVLPRFMLAYPFLELFKDSALLAYGLTGIQLALQSALFGWLARRRTLEQQLWLALVFLIALAIAVTTIAVGFDIDALTRNLRYD